MVDQNPIGKSSRSNPVTYIQAYDEIRNLYAKQQKKKKKKRQKNAWLPAQALFL